jgi:hypothetical protein
VEPVDPFVELIEVVLALVGIGHQSELLASIIAIVVADEALLVHDDLGDEFTEQSRIFEDGFHAVIRFEWFAFVDTEISEHCIKEAVALENRLPLGQFVHLLPVGQTAGMRLGVVLCGFDIT